MTRLNQLQFSSFRNFAINLTSFLLLFLYRFTWASWNPKEHSTGLVLFYIIGIFWVILRLRQGRILRIPKIIIPLLAYIGFRILNLFISPLPRFGLDIVLNEVAILFLFFFFVDTLNLGWETRVWENALLTLAVLDAILEFVPFFLWHQEWWQITGQQFSFPPVSFRVPGILLTHPNIVSGFLNISILIIVYRLMLATGKIWKIYWGVILSFLLVIEFLTSSRSGWLGLITGLTVMLLLINYESIREFLRNPKINVVNAMRRRTLIAIGALVLALLLIIPKLNRYVRGIGHGPLSDRLDIWNYSWELMLSSPIWGYGPGSHPFLNALRSSEIYDSNKYYHAHNFFFQLGVESGVIGLLLISWFIYRLTIGVLSFWKQNHNGGLLNMQIAAYSGVIVAIMVQHSLDYFLFDPLYTLSAFLILALTIHTSKRNQGIEISSRKIIFPVFGLLGLLSIGSFHLMRGANEFTDGLILADQMNLMATRERICQASDINPKNSFYNFQCGFVNGLIAYTYDNSNALDLSIKNYKEGLSLDPFWYHHWAYLASLEWQAGYYNSGLDHMRRAVINSPNDILLLVNLGWMEEEAGNNQQALDAYRGALEGNPWLVNDSFFSKTELRKTALIEIPENYYWHGWNALRQGDFETAEIMFEQARKDSPLHPTPYAFLALTKQKAGLTKEAWQYVQKSNFFNQGTYLPYLLVSQVAIKQHKYEQANKYLTGAMDILENGVAYNYRRYYDAAYRSLRLPYSLSPFLLRLGFDPEMRNDLYELEDYLSNREDISRTQLWISWIRESEDK